MTGPVCVCVISMSSILSAEMIRISAEPQWPPTSTNTTANQPTPRNSIDRTHFWNWPGDHAHTQGVPYIGIYCDATCTTIYYSCRKTVTVVNSVVTCLTSGYKLNWCGIVKRNIAIFQCTDDFLVIDLWCWRHVSVLRSLMQGLDLLDSGVFDLSDWDQRLPPPAAKTAVQTLTVVVISPEQAGDGWTFERET